MAEPVKVRRLSDEEGRKLQRLVRRGEGKGQASVVRRAMVVLASLLGVGVHVLSALPDLVADNKVGYRDLPLRIALRTGASRLWVLGCWYVALVVAGLAATALTVGLRR